MRPGTSGISGALQASPRRSSEQVNADDIPLRGPIFGDLDALSKELDALAESIDRLGAKLIPVSLVVEAKQSSNGYELPPSGECCEVRRIAQAHVTRVSQLRARMNGLFEALDI